MRATPWVRSIAVLTLTLLLALSASAAPGIAQPPQPPEWEGCPPGVRCPPEVYKPGEGPPARPFPWIGGAEPPAPAAGVSLLAAGGPDDFGYTWDDAEPFSWIDATTAEDTELAGDDELTAAIDIGFDFKFYENTYSQLYISTNGLVSFGGADDWSNQPIPSLASPNDFIAAFWGDLCVNVPEFNTGTVFYQQVGTAPERFFVAEWHKVSLYGSTDLLTFQVILHENGDIVVQYLSLSGYLEGAAVGIEDSAGTTGLQYLYNEPGLEDNKAVRFRRPAPSARVGVSPTYGSRLTTVGETVAFQLAIRNTGDRGADVFDLTASSAWPVAFYRADGSTPLTDTDGDGLVDTGSIAQDATITITARVTTPGTARAADGNTASFTIRSSVDPTKSTTASLQTVVPAPFAQVYSDDADGAMSIDLVRPHAQVARKATADWRYGYDMAVAEAPGGFAYVWSRNRCLGDPCTIYLTEIEYALLDRYGNVALPATRLTDHSQATVHTYDHYPAVAVAPNGHIGVLWQRYLWNESTGQVNFNIHFAILDRSGDLVHGPANVTNNEAWGPWGELNVPRYFRPRIAATDDNRFVLAWLQEQQESGGWVDDIYYAVRGPAGGEVRGPTRLTQDTPGDSGYLTPALARISSARAILSWASRAAGNGDIRYAVLDSSGAIVKPATGLSVDDAVVDWWNCDVAELSDGRILLAWEAWGCFPDEWTSRIRFAILDSSYNRVVPPTCLGGHPAAIGGDTGASVAADASGNAVLTWTDDDDGDHRHLFYALVGSNGTVRTSPMILRTAEVPEWGSENIGTSLDGYGNTSYSPPRVFLPLVLR